MKTWKRFLALGLVTIITAMMFVGCGSSDISEGVAKNDYPITINGVTLNSQPTGVAVLSQNIADVILTGGFEATLKAKSEDCTQEDLSILPNLTIDDAQGSHGRNGVLVYDLIRIGEIIFHEFTNLFTIDFCNI